MTTLAEFLLARIAEDEEAAKAASPGGWRYGSVESVAGGTLYDETRRISDLTYEQPGDHDGSIVRHLLSAEADANGTHIARHDPARVLAECAAKRAIVGLCSPSGEDEDGNPFYVGGYGEAYLDALHALAAPFADHPDYRAEWAL